MVIGQPVERSALHGGSLAATQLRQRDPVRIVRKSGGLGCAAVPHPGIILRLSLNINFRG